MLPSKTSKSKSLGYLYSIIPDIFGNSHRQYITTQKETNALFLIQVYQRVIYS